MTLISNLRSHDWKWWIWNLLHIETLAVIFIAIAIIYVLCTHRRRKKYQFEGLNGEPIKISKGLISQKRKKKKKNKHENRCREIFQNLLGVRFKSVRPEWLKNPVTGHNLELDGFNPNIHTPIGRGLAFEYDGEQHSKYNKHFHRGGPSEFIYQTKKDSWKDKICKERGILLIRIPHFVAFQDLERYIKQKLQKVGMGDFSSASSFSFSGMYD